MLNVVVAGASVLTALGALIVAAHHVHTVWGLPAEWSRKGVHVGMGLVCATFPWVFPNPAPVFVLAVIATAAMIAIRLVPSLRVRHGCALNDVKRHSYGEFAFIAGVACSFALAHGNAVEYLIPVSVLTFADSLAAVIGQQFGKLPFAIPGGTKTIEGSTAFFAVAFVCAALSLLAVHAPYALSTALLAASALTLVEAFSWNGFDNLAVPIVGVLLLRLLAGGSGLELAS